MRPSQTNDCQRNGRDPGSDRGGGRGAGRLLGRARVIIVIPVPVVVIPIGGRGQASRRGQRDRRAFGTRGRRGRNARSQGCVRRQASPGLGARALVGGPRALRPRAPPRRTHAQGGEGAPCGGCAGGGRAPLPHVRRAPQRRRPRRRASKRVDPPGGESFSHSHVRVRTIAPPSEASYDLTRTRSIPHPSPPPDQTS